MRSRLSPGCDFTPKTPKQTQKPRWQNANGRPVPDLRPRRSGHGAPPGRAAPCAFIRGWELQPRRPSRPCRAAGREGGRCRRRPARRATHPASIARPRTARQRCPSPPAVAPPPPAGRSQGAGLTSRPGFPSDRGRGSLSGAAA